MIGRNGLNTIQWIGMGNLQFARIIQLTRTGEPGGGYIGRVRVNGGLIGLNVELTVGLTVGLTLRLTVALNEQLAEPRTGRVRSSAPHLACGVLSTGNNNDHKRVAERVIWASHMSESYNPGTDPADLSARTPCGFWSFNCQQKNNKKKEEREKEEKFLWLFRLD